MSNPLGLRIRENAYTEVEDRFIREAWAAGIKVQDIAFALDRPFEGCRRHCALMKLPDRWSHGCNAKWEPIVED